MYSQNFGGPHTEYLKIMKINMIYYNEQGLAFLVAFVIGDRKPTFFIILK